MKLEIEKSEINANFVAPPSKSLAIRYMICSCLSGKGVVKNVGNSEDVLTCFDCLRNLGFDCELINNDFVVKGKKIIKNAVLNCNQSATLMRFLIPICCALNINAKIIGDKILLNRPINELIKCLNDHGANINDLVVNGKIVSGDYYIDSSKTSQYVSGLMIALSLLDKKSKIICSKKVSVDYINLTINVLKTFGIKVKRFNKSYIIYPNKFKENLTVDNEGDFSSSAFLSCFGAISNNAVISNLNKKSYQGDKRIVNALKKYGAKIKWDKDRMIIKKFKQNGFIFDCENNPDLFPVLAILGAFSNGKVVLRNIQRLAYKETNRIDSIKNSLIKCGISCEIQDNNFVVYGGKTTCCEFDGCFDHRTIMAEIVISLLTDGKSTIINVEGINKSYSYFVSDLRNCGGKINVIL